ncbi:MAG: hypothetical protein V4577_19080 [Bacteroidota bacterium]
MVKIEKRCENAIDIFDKFMEDNRQIATAMVDVWPLSIAGRREASQQPLQQKIPPGLPKGIKY